MSLGGDAGNAVHYHHGNGLQLQSYYEIARADIGREVLKILSATETFRLGIRAWRRKRESERLRLLLDRGLDGFAGVTQIEL